MRSLFAALVLAAAAQPALAADDCAECYRLVRHPAVHATVQQPYVLRPAQTIARYVPPAYGTVEEQLLLAPERQVTRVVSPAVYETRLEQVELRPAGRQWVVRRDRHGRTIGCWVDRPARYGTVRRKVLVQQAETTTETLPAVYATRSRPVMLRGGYIQRGVAPPVIATQPRDVVLAPEYRSWEPLAR